jgi:hypothetical protein
MEDTKGNIRALGWARLQKRFDQVVACRAVSVVDNFADAKTGTDATWDPPQRHMRPLASPLSERTGTSVGPS